MYLDCSTCPGRGHSCAGCVVSVLLDPRPAMDPEVAAALDVLQGAGLIGPAHLAVVDDGPAGHGRALSAGRRAG